MQINLPGDVEQLLRAAVAAGRYADADEAVVQGLRLLLASADRSSPETSPGAVLSGAPVAAETWAALEQGAEDLRHGRTVDAASVLRWLDDERHQYLARKRRG